MTNTEGAVESTQKLFRGIYQGFFLRDLLSFAVPGCILIIGVATTIGQWPNLLREVREVGLLPGIVGLGVAYTIGFALQSIGVATGIISFLPPDAIPQPRRRLLWKVVAVVPMFGWLDRPPEVAGWYEKVLKLDREGTEFAKSIYEREIIFKQMTGNTAVAILCLMVCQGATWWWNLAVIPRGWWLVLIAEAVFARFLLRDHARTRRTQQMWLEAVTKPQNATPQSAPQATPGTIS